MDNTVTALNKDWGSHYGVDLQDRQHVSSAPNASDSSFAYSFLHEHEMGEDATNSTSMASSQSTDEFLHTGGSLLQHLLPPISASDSKLEQKLDDSEKVAESWLLQDSSVSDPSHDHSASVLLHGHHDPDPLRLVHHHHHQQQQHQQQHPLQHHQHHQQQHHQHQHHGHVRDVDGSGQPHYSPQHARQMRALNDFAMSPPDYRASMEPTTGSKRPREQGAQMPQKRRASHNATEQRRRNKIKERIEELRATVPICDSERKADILKKSVDYIKFLQQQYSDLIIKAKKLQEEYYNIGGKQDFLSPHGNHTQQQQQQHHQQHHHHLQHQQQQHQHHSYHSAPSPPSSASSSSSSSSPSHLNHMGNPLSNGSMLIANGASMAHAYSLPQIQSIHYSSPPPSSVSIPSSPPLIHMQHQQHHHHHHHQQQQVLLSHVLPQHATGNGNGNMLSYSPMSSIVPSKDDKKLSADSPSESSPDTP
eukprot:TRINITY_DN3444_c0_g1_i2.p1 TRINITY_DN3444_c0_g1~~TRINITY_DN3444_c0_g1_i2.p1  ORF type:complete len:476 (-),score=176.92 TRINITY_DN3444_c0_g1_i2:300-1727(-)